MSPIHTSPAGHSALLREGIAHSEAGRLWMELPAREPLWRRLANTLTLTLKRKATWHVSNISTSPSPTRTRQPQC